MKEFKGYDKPHGPSFPTLTSILQVFTLIFTNELVSNIVTKTNRYAQFCLKEKFEAWKCVTSNEILCILWLPHFDGNGQSSINKRLLAKRHSI